MVKSRCLLTVPFAATNVNQQDLNARCIEFNGTVVSGDSMNGTASRCELANLQTSAQCMDACMGADGPKPAAAQACLRQVFTSSDCVRVNTTDAPVAFIQRW